MYAYVCVCVYVCVSVVVSVVMKKQKNNKKITKYVINTNRHKIKIIDQNLIKKKIIQSNEEKLVVKGK